MQNKGLIRFLAIAFLLVCLFQLSFSFATKRIENKAKAIAANYVESEQGQKDITTCVKNHGNNELTAAELKNITSIVTDSLRNVKETHFLDSMANEKIWLGFTYRKCQAREINLGLDLKGGMNVMLEVSTVDVVKALANITAPVTISELYDEVANDLPEGMTKGKVQYAVTRLWSDEIAKTEGKVNAYSLR